MLSGIGLTDASYSMDAANTHDGHGKCPTLLLVAPSPRVLTRKRLQQGCTNCLCIADPGVLYLAGGG